jgi:hypothetical protein
MTDIEPPANEDAAIESVVRVPKKKQVLIELMPEAHKCLNNLKATTAGYSDSDVVNSALRVYWALVEGTRGGKRLLARDKLGGVSAVKLPL